MPSPDANRRTIWVVDDSPLDAERVRRQLAGAYHVEVMHDGSAVLERLATERPPDLLVLDWLMPGVSGIDVCRYLRSPEGNMPQVPVLLLTARSELQQVVEGLSAGANDYLGKPFAPEELEARVSALLRTRELLARAETAEATVRTLLETAPDAIFSLDAQGRVTYVNQEGCRVLERPARNILGERVQTLLPGLALRNITVAPGEGLFPLPDVEVGNRIFSASVRLLPSDSAANTTLALRDVTSRRQAEARRLDFYSIIAHDLRTPLSAILLRLETVFRGKYGLLPAALIADLRTMQGNVRTLVAMINDFLELARFEGVGHKVEYRPVDLSELVRSTAEDFRPLLDANHLRWEHLAPVRHALVLGDSKRLIQVLANLLGNAIKFTPPGGLITTRVQSTPEHVEVVVEDSGPGIPPELVPTIFQRYTRLQPSQAGVGGTGLGLMIVREVVEAHGGRVGVESRVGEGSRFWFRLPRAEPEVLAAPQV